MTLSPTALGLAQHMCRREGWGRGAPGFVCRVVQLWFGEQEKGTRFGVHCFEVH